MRPTVVPADEDHCRQGQPGVVLDRRCGAAAQKPCFLCATTDAKVIANAATVSAIQNFAHPCYHAVRRYRSYRSYGTSTYTIATVATVPTVPTVPTARYLLLLRYDIARVPTVCRSVMYSSRGPSSPGPARGRWCEEYTPSTLDTYPFLNPLQLEHVNTVTMSELITTFSAYHIINGDSPMTSVANTVAMTTLAVHTLQPLIFYRLWAHSPRRNWSATPSLTLLTFAAWLGEHTSRIVFLTC